MNESIESSDLGEGGVEILRRVRDGESVVVTEDGTPVADVVPRQRARQPGSVADFDRRVAQSPPVDAVAWFRDIGRSDTGSAILPGEED